MTKTVMTILCVSTCLFFLNIVNAEIGHQQKPSKTAVKNESISVAVADAYYKDGDLFIKTEDAKIISIPDNTILLTPSINVKELLVKREWNFIFPFSLEEIEYEYLNMEKQ